MKTIAITIDETLLDRLEQVAAGRGGGAANRSKLIRDAVAEYVRRLERAAADEREAAIVDRHRARLARQATAALRAQAKP